MGFRVWGFPDLAQLPGSARLLPAVPPMSAASHGGPCGPSRAAIFKSIGGNAKGADAAPRTGAGFGASRGPDTISGSAATSGIAMESTFDLGFRDVGGFFRLFNRFMTFWTVLMAGAEN